jgi:hypothetical protein
MPYELQRKAYIEFEVQIMNFSILCDPLLLTLVHFLFISQILTDSLIHPTNLNILKLQLKPYIKLEVQIVKFSIMYDTYISTGVGSLLFYVLFRCFEVNNQYN